MHRQIIYLHAEAPAKPKAGQTCNGCGVCCSAAPCPIGVLISRRRSGACAALRWEAAGRRYRCGLVTAPCALWPWLPRAAAAPVARLARRWIAAATGCDSTASTEAAGAA